MSYVAEIASAARTISAQELVRTSEQAQMAVLKMQMQAETMIQQQMASMITQVHGHLGSNVNISA